jgi:hypothetical protein
MRRMPLLLTALSTFALSCVNGPAHADDSSSPPNAVPSQQPAPEFDEARWTDKETAQTQQIATMLQTKLTLTTSGDAAMRRDAHPKHHGCVEATFKVDNSKLPAPMRAGIFSDKNQDQTFNAWVRFSNGNPNANLPDYFPDVRGMAIKLMGVRERNFLALNGDEPFAGTQDFILINTRTFFLADLSDYVNFISTVTEDSPLKKIEYFAKNPEVTLSLTEAVAQVSINPLEINFFSTTPYKLGNSVIRYKAETCNSDALPIAIAVPTKNMLQEHMLETLSQKSACFDLKVQIRPETEKERLPVENPTLEWNKDANSWIPVAHLVIPPQTKFANPDRMNFCENLSFNPWRAPPENRPLGAINRSRLEIYRRISEVRHAHNGIAQVEPQNFMPCETAATAALCQATGAR